MNGNKILIVVTLLVAAVMVGEGWAELVSMSEAETIATNWITLTIHNEGAWGESPNATVGEIEDLRDDGDLVAYVCHIKPSGYVVVPVHRGLAPVKAYSETSVFNAADKQGPVEVIRARLGCMLKTIAAEFGPPESVSPEALGPILENDYRSGWTDLMVDPEVYRPEGIPRGKMLDLPDPGPGDWITTTVWNQSDPYNSWCPEPPPGSECTWQRCAAGCTPVAGAQIMRYWNWPPWGSQPPHNDEYMWRDMPDSIDGGSPEHEIEAISELIAEIGNIIGATYCDTLCRTGGGMQPMRAAFSNNFLYDGATTLDYRRDWTADSWWNMAVIQVQAGWPVQYAMTGHSMVLDGYNEVGGTRYYHFNMGWGGTGNPDLPCWPPIPYTNTWYAMDVIPCSDPDDERMIRGIRPNVVMEYPISGVYVKPPVVPYRYLADILSSTGASFDSGQYLQFFREGRIWCAGPGQIVFHGSPSGGSTYIFNEGDPTVGIRIANGEMIVHQSGGANLYWRDE
jgi:hypothetical protein